MYVRPAHFGRLPWAIVYYRAPGGMVPALEFPGQYSGAANAGLHIAAVLREGLRENEVLQAAARHGIVTSGLHDCFHTGPAQSGLLIGFGAVSTTGLPTALRTLDRILAS
jgi:DNA-binding transcriptional MocR family regulator